MKPTILPLVCAMAAAPGFADVTVRSKMDYKLASYLPAPVADGMNKAMAETVASGTVIKGVKTEETLVTVTVTLPGPMAAMGAVTLELHMWAATNEELDRLPALKELATYHSTQGMEANSAMSRMFAGIPGVGEKLRTQ